MARRCAALGCEGAQLEIPAEVWAEHWIAPDAGAPPDYLYVDYLVGEVTQHFKASSIEDGLVRELVTEALRLLAAAGYVDLWPDSGRPSLFRATVECVACFPDLPRLAGGPNPNPRPTAPASLGLGDGPADGEPYPGWQLLSSRELDVIYRLDEAGVDFVPSGELERVHGTRTSARAIVQRIRQKCPLLGIESARDAYCAGELDAAAKKGYRLSP